MAGRFVSQKFNSTMWSRSRSLLGAHAPAPGHAGAPATGTASCRLQGTSTHSHAPMMLLKQTAQCSTTSMPSIIINHLKPACVGSSGGAKGSFSSSASTRHEISRSAKMAAWAAEWDAKSAAWQARRAACEAEIEATISDFDKFLRNQLWLWGFAVSCWIGVAFLVEEKCKSLCNGQSGSHHCTSCCNGQCVFSES